QYDTAGAPGAIAIADVNNDGIPDLVAATGSSQSLIEVKLGIAPGGTFHGNDNCDSISCASPAPLGTKITVADFNGDGLPDIALGTPNGVEVMRGRGDGHFDAAVAVLATTT